MSTSCIPSPKVISLHLQPGQNTGRFQHTVTQEDLNDLLARQTRMREAIETHEEQFAFIKSALENGADVEPGLHSAELVSGRRGAYRVPAGRFVKLLVK